MEVISRLLSCDPVDRREGDNIPFRQTNRARHRAARKSVDCLRERADLNDPILNEECRWCRSNPVRDGRATDDITRGPEFHRATDRDSVDCEPTRGVNGECSTRVDVDRTATVHVECISTGEA